MADAHERDGWEEHRRQQIRDVLRTTPAQRLAWLEEMIDLVARLRARRTAAGGRSPGDAAGPRRHDRPAGGS